MFQFSILKKFIFAFLILSIVPLSVLGSYTWQHLREIGQRAISSSSDQLEKMAKESIELQAIVLANQVTQLLESCEADLMTLKMLERTAETYTRFSMNHHRIIWKRVLTGSDFKEIFETIPLYREMAFIDKDGNERIRIVNNKSVGSHELRNVSRPENTTYRNEKYFEEASKLKNGEIYVSHVTGWYVTKEDQLMGADSVEKASGGKSFEGVIRFASSCYDKSGNFQGIAVISLDHRHLMGMTLHVLPTEERFVVFPSYSSGNYAFMFDDEGWIISHPKFWNIRGILQDGSQFDPEAAYYNIENVIAGKVPFNLDHVSFINTNYQLISMQTRKGLSGVTNTINVGGTARVIAFAPINYTQGVYSKHGIFGGITIGVQTDKFMEPAVMAGSRIMEKVILTKKNSMIILGVTAFAAITLAFILARKFTRPILLLSRKTKEIAAGKITENIDVKTGDEMEVLARNFYSMAVEIHNQTESLEKSLLELAESKKSIEQYSIELEKQIRILKSVHSLSHFLGNEFDRELVLQRVLQTCVAGLGFDRSLLYLFDPETRRLICHQTFGFTLDHALKAKNASYDIDVHDCVPTKVFRTGETIFVSNIHTDKIATPLDVRICEVGEIDFFVFTPIRSADRIIGILGADTRDSRRQINKLEVEFLQIVANDAAIAIERTELYRRFLSERDFIKAIFANIASGIITLDEKLNITFLNPYSLDIFSVDQKNSIGMHYREVFREYEPWIKIIDGFLLEEEKKQAIEHKLDSLDGRTFFFDTHFSKIRQKDKNIIYLLFLRDITARKKLEDHIRRSDRLISVGVLAAGIAHEMRNPLTGISLLLDDLHDHIGDNGTDREMIQGALQEIDRLETLISGLLDFASPSARIKLKTRPIKEVLQRTLFMIKKQCDNNKVIITEDVDDFLPEISFDPERIQQAILNLILNSIQAMPAGGNILIRVQVVDTEESMLAMPAVRIVVTDTGVGIAAEDIPYIFDPFFSRKPSGHGLGLAIVHSIIEEHRGRISVISELEKMTIFCIDLPVGECGESMSELNGKNTYN